MLLTEAEAKLRRCPHGLEDAGCVATLCMAWRWSSYARDEDNERFVPAEDGPELGYCGLAGRPEA